MATVITLSLIHIYFPYLEDNHGIIVNEATNDNKVEIITVTQNCVIMLETKPVLIAIG